MRVQFLLVFCMLCLAVAAQAAPAAAGIGHSARRAQRRKSSVVRTRRAAVDIVEADVKVESSAARRVDPYLNRKGQELLDRYQKIEQDKRLQEQVKERQMHYADTLHIANHGQKSTKFPMITRVSASIGAVAAVMNVFNTIVAAKTTHAATVPFSSPPTPPTLLDNAGHWDGESVTLLKPPPSKSKRDLASEADVEKRWLLAAGAGTAVGAMFAPGFWGMVRGKGSDAEKPPFDPYSPDMLKQKDPYAVLATSPGQPAPLLAGVEPVLEPQNAHVPQNAAPLSSNLVPVLQKRDEEWQKRQLVNGAGSSLWSKVAMAATAGSVIPIIFHGVSHSRWRSEHPRDRDIIGELDDTPTYGAVGVPNRVPGQIATYAMPGFTTYAQQVRAAQLVAQQKLVLDQQRQVVAGNGEALTAVSAAAPVLSKRSLGQPELSLVKRGKMLVGGMLAAFGLALGYLQSATQFPEDRQAEKDKKKKEAEKKLQEQQQQPGQPQQSASGNAAGGAPAYAFSPLQASTPSSLVPTSGAQPDLVGAAVPYNLVPMSGAPILGKRSGDHSSHVEKRGLNMGNKLGRFLEISGFTMFIGTLAANVMVSAKQESKLVPYVTPNAGTKGPVPLGGDLYAQYLRSKQSDPIPQNVGTAAPVTAPSFLPESGAVSPALGAPVLQKRRPFGTSPDPMLSKRLFPGLFRAATVVEESTAARTAGMEVAGKAGTVFASEAAAGGAARVAEVRASENAAGGMLGAAQPAMLRTPAPATMFPIGRAGLPAAAPAAGELGVLGNAGGAGRGVSAVETPVAGEAAMAPEAVAAKKKNTMSKIGILTTAAGVTMLANDAT